MVKNTEYRKRSDNLKSIKNDSQIDKQNGRNCRSTVFLKQKTKSSGILKSKAAYET